MIRFRQRCDAVWEKSQAQDIAEYLVMLAVILVLVIGTVKLIGKHRSRHAAAPVPPAQIR